MRRALALMVGLLALPLWTGVAHADDLHIASAYSFLFSQWTLENPSDADMDVPEAWDVSTGAGQTVGVVDTGVLATHRGLSGRISRLSRNFVGSGSSFADGNGHGTFVAGEVASRQYANAGTTGVAPDATVAALRALDANGDGSDADIARAFDYAGDANLRIVNASLNGPPSATIEHAIAAHPRTLYVVAAGNDGTDDDAKPTYPCSLGLANVLCVSATDTRDRPAPRANRGAHSVDLYAPGERIESTWGDGGWRYESGTSMAAGNVAGEAALVLAAKPSLTTHQLKLALMYSGDRVPALSGLSVTGRRANADGAVRMARSGTIPADADEDGVVDSRDATPRGDDADRDGVPRLDDACPTVAAATANGCPAPRPPAAPPKPAPAPPEPAPAPPAHATPAPAPKPATVPVGHKSHARADRDHDGRVGRADACPRKHARTRNGCPLPKLRSLRVKVSRHTHRATVTVRAGSKATVALRIEARRCRHGHKHCRWRRVARHTAKHHRTAKLSRRLHRGRYRAVVTLRSDAGHTRPKRRTFKVR